jgi:hypothetical protein
MFGTTIWRIRHSLVLAVRPLARGPKPKQSSVVFPHLVFEKFNFFIGTAMVEFKIGGALSYQNHHGDICFRPLSHNIMNRSLFS